MTLPLPLRLCLLGIMAPALSEASQTQSLDVPHSSPTKGNIPVAQKHFNSIESDGFITIWKNDFEAKNFMNCSDMCNGIDKFPAIDTIKNGNSYLDLLNQELDLSGADSNNHSNNLNTLALASELKKLSEDHKQIHDSASLIRMSGCSDFEFNGATSKTMGLTKANTGLSNSSDFSAVKDVKVVNGNCDKLNSEKLQISIFGSSGLANVFDNGLLDIMESNSVSPSQQNNQFDQGSHSAYEAESLEHHTFLPDIDVMSMIDDNLVENLVGDPRELVVRDRKEDLEKRHHEIERKCERILRRLYKVQSRGLSDHISHQLCKYVDYAHKTLNIPRSSTLKEKEEGCRAKDVQELLQQDNVKLLSTSALVNLVKKLEMEPDSVSKSSFKSPHVLGRDPDRVTVKFTDPVKKSIESTCGNLLQQLRRTAKVTDPDLTASSSGSGSESCDELETVSKVDVTHEEPINSVPLQKRALWRWATERAKISSRWAWLRSQIVDLDHKIKDYSELYRNMRKDKQQDWFIDKQHSRLSWNVNCVVDSHSYSRTSANIKSVNNQCADSLECPLSAEPLSSLDIDDSCQSCRVRPIKPIRKRKYIHTNGLYSTSEKAARPCKFTCGCLPPLSPCILCGGKRRNVVEVDSDLSFNDKIAVMDPNYHPVLSFTSDIPLHLYFNSKLHNLPKNFGFQNKSRSTFRKMEPSDKKFTIKAQDYYKENGRTAFRKYKRNCGTSEYDDEKKSSRGNSPNSNESRLERRERLLSHEVPRRKRQDSAYDIDNIVIPYSIASSARVEKLPYKEILTPGWREVAEVTDFEFQTNSSQNGESTEDTSDDAIALRHHKLELDEKQRFGTAAPGQGVSAVGSGRGRPRRIDSRADSSGTNTPDPMSPYPLDPNTDSYCSPLGTPPSTPRTDSDVLLLGQHSKGERRIRTTSNSQRRANYQDDSRCSTPLLECDVCVAIDLYIKIKCNCSFILQDYVQPYSPRVFPLNDEESLELVDKLVSDMTTEHEGVISNCDPLIGDQTLVDLGDLQGKATSNGHDAGCSNPG